MERASLSSASFFFLISSAAFLSAYIFAIFYISSSLISWAVFYTFVWCFFDAYPFSAIGGCKCALPSSSNRTFFTSIDFSSSLENS